MRITFARGLAALTAVLVVGALAFIAVSIRDYFAQNDMRDQIAAYDMRGVTPEDAGMADFLTRAVCPVHADEPACAGAPEDRAALVHQLCVKDIFAVTNSQFGPPDEAQAETIAAYKYCQFAPPELGDWWSDTKPGLTAWANALALLYVELIAVGLAWRRWTRTVERALLAAGLALGALAFALAPDRYSLAMRDIAALAVLALAFAAAGLWRRLAG